jgi:hypothetical protein
MILVLDKKKQPGEECENYSRKQNKYDCLHEIIIS